MRGRIGRRGAALRGAAKGVGLFALLGFLFLGLEAEAKDKERGLRRAKRATRSLYRSPDGRHWLWRAPSGALLLNGKQLHLRGRQVGRPVWRRDGLGVAVLQRQRHHLQLVVIADMDGSEPLVWRVPDLVGRRPHIQWLGRKAVGLGSAPLVPRVVFRWTTHLARR